MSPTVSLPELTWWNRSVLRTHELCSFGSKLQEKIGNYSYKIEWMKFVSWFRGILGSLFREGKSCWYPFQGINPTWAVSQPNVEEWTGVAEDLDQCCAATKRNSRTVHCRKSRSGAQFDNHSSSQHWSAHQHSAIQQYSRVVPNNSVCPQTCKVAGKASEVSRAHTGWLSEVEILWILDA